MSDNIKPRIGLGLWKIAKADCAETVYQAIKLGYRHLDSACDYGNEVEVGQGIRKAIDAGLCQREDLWVTSKLWNTDHSPEHVKPALAKTLADLGLDYLDSYLIHFPIALAHVPVASRYPAEWVDQPDSDSPVMVSAAVPLYKTWQAMEELQRQGLVKRIGVCNYNTGLLHDLMAYAKIKPAELQIESHPYLSQERLIKLAQQYGIEVTAFSPLGAQSYLELDMATPQQAVLEQTVLKDLAQKYKKSAAQIALRWGVQRGCYLICKSTRTERLKENLDIFDFELEASEMTAIAELNRNQRFNDPGDFCEAAFNTFHPIYD